MSNSDDFAQMDRRTAIKWMLTACATLPLWNRGAFGADAPATAASGYGTDPDLLRSYQSGDLWPLTFDQKQQHTAAALCALIIPADERSPSAAQLNVHRFIDEWISAPYPTHVQDRRQILEGLAWLDLESRRRFSKAFAELDTAQQTAICDDICYAPKAVAKYQQPAAFFARFRDLTAGGFYTTPEGTKDLGYVGNIPLPAFPGPPPEVLKQVGLL